MEESHIPSLPIPSLHTHFSLPTVRHEVALPTDFITKENTCLNSDKIPAKTYPFTLDPFQAISISCLEMKESVLVSAHTSAGKTVVAEYAIAMALRDKQRVVYTSPIKALSNQKYRELLDLFGDVGLMTGDVTINPTASCLVMTTEILRSMLYRGSEVMREVAWVVYDEIHYMRDKERGVVWEETLILVPSTVRFVFLSATIPNALQFAEWICHLHLQPCHVVYTEMRPTPLQHYVFGSGGEGIHLVLDEKKNFREDNLTKAIQAITDKEKGVGGHESRSDLQKIVRLVMSKNLHPAIVFSFARRECEANALQMASMDFNSEDEKELVSIVFSNAIEALNEEDRQLPQISSLLPLLKRGIALHHSGLLPVLKEVIEILFQEGLIKVLFATETFAIGLNMPARTVIFTAIRKFDGQAFRYLSPGEYIQMSGRAGRRGLDDRGLVILMMNEKIPAETLRGIMNGQADPLHSAFRLSYNMVLNLMRVEGFHPEWMLERSFMQFQNRCSLPSLTKKVQEKEKNYNSSIKEASGLDPAADDNEEYWLTGLLDHLDLIDQYSATQRQVQSKIFDPSVILPFLQPGRLIKYESEGNISEWCVSLSIYKMKGAKPPNTRTPWIVDLFEASGDISPVSLDTLVAISTIRMVLPGNMKGSEGIQKAKASLLNIIERFKDESIPELSATDDLKLGSDASFVRDVIKRDALLKKITSQKKLFNNKLIEQGRKIIQAKAMLLESQRELRAATLIVQMEDLKARKRVLRLLGFTTSDSSEIITVKGRVACEISTGDELLLTELLFSGLFNEISSEQAVSLLSCFVCEEKATDGIISGLPNELRQPFVSLQHMAKEIGKTLASVGANENTNEEYIDQFRPTLMEVVLSWAKGAKFAAICKITDVFEGSIIRSMRRLEELLRQMCQGAKSVGSTELEIKFAEGISKIKRDIVFANSLYL